LLSLHVDIWVFNGKFLGDLGMIEMILKVEMNKVSWKSISDFM